jgi:hypothetical protein
MLRAILSTKGQSCRQISCLHQGPCRRTEGGRGGGHGAPALVIRSRRAAQIIDRAAERRQSALPGGSPDPRRVAPYPFTTQHPGPGMSARRCPFSAARPAGGITDYPHRGCGAPQRRPADRSWSISASHPPSKCRPACGTAREAHNADRTLAPGRRIIDTGMSAMRILSRYDFDADSGEMA